MVRGLQLHRAFAIFFVSRVLISVVIARVTQRTLYLSAYSEGLNCSNVVYAIIDNDICTDTSVCTIHNDSDGSFHDTEMSACILDRESYLSATFSAVSYYTVELYPDDCMGRSYNTRTFIADGNCHPYALSQHFRVEIVNEGFNTTTSVRSYAEADCYGNWTDEWFVNTTTQCNTEACVTDGTNTWKSYFITSSSDTQGSTSDPPATAPTPTSSTSPPAATTATPTPTANVSILDSSLATSLCTASNAVVLFGVTLLIAL